MAREVRRGGRKPLAFLHAPMILTAMSRHHLLVAVLVLGFCVPSSALDVDASGKDPARPPLGSAPYGRLLTARTASRSRLVPACWGRAVYVPDRDHRGAGSTYSSLSARGRIEHSVIADDRAGLPVRLRAGFGLDLRHNRVLKRGNVPGNWVYALDDPSAPSPYAALLIGNADTMLRAAAVSLSTGDGEAVDTSGSDSLNGNDDDAARNVIIRPLKESTLPTRNLHRIDLDLAGEVSLAPRWALIAAGRTVLSGSKGGILDHDADCRGGLAHRLGPGSRLLVGAEYRSLTGSRLTEDRVLPVIEWRVDTSRRLLFTVGFPRSGIVWHPYRRLQVEANYRFPQDLDAAVTWSVTPRLGCSVQLWHGSTGFTAGHNLAVYDYQLRSWFMHPNPWRYRIGEKNHIYIRGGGIGARLTWSHPAWGLAAGAGPVWTAPELWHEGPDSAHAHRRARLDAAVGVEGALHWEF